MGCRTLHILNFEAGDLATPAGDTPPAKGANVKPDRLNGQAGRHLSPSSAESGNPRLLQSPFFLFILWLGDFEVIEHRQRASVSP